MTTTTELVPTGPVRASLPDKVAYAKELANSGLLPTSYRKQPANVLYAVEYGDMLGLAPMAAITGVHVIEGKPTASAALISALVRRAGHRLRVTGDDQRATVEIVRCDDPEFTFRSVWTLDRAKTAGLTGKGVWKNYPAAMLKARAITECARDACEEALLGMHYTPEELGADVDEDGIPVRASAVVVGAAAASAPAADPTPEPEPDWEARITEHETARDRIGLVGLWKQARQARPDDAELLARITAAGERVKTALTEQQDDAGDKEDTGGVVDAELVEQADEDRREKRMHALLHDAGVGDKPSRDRRLALLGTIIGREVTTSAEVVGEDREQVIAALERYQRNGDLERAEECAAEDAAFAEYNDDDADGGAGS